jgi:amino acid permease
MREAQIKLVSILVVLAVIYGVVMYTDIFPGPKTQVVNMERHITDWDDDAID